MTLSWSGVAMTSLGRRGPNYQTMRTAQQLATPGEPPMPGPYTPAVLDTLHKRAVLHTEVVNPANH